MHSENANINISGRDNNNVTDKASAYLTVAYGNSLDLQWGNASNLPQGHDSKMFVLLFSRLKVMSVNMQTATLPKPWRIIKHQNVLHWCIERMRN